MEAGAELKFITELIDKQFERVETLFREGEISDKMYQEQTLALINKLNILVVEEVMADDVTLTPIAPHRKFPVVLGE